MSTFDLDYFAKRIPVILDLGFRERAIPSLKKYLELLIISNEELNLISRKMTFADLIDNHVIDCLLPLKSFPENLSHVADLGSGGGLPAVIYALQFPDTKFILFEKSILKQEFLKKCKLITDNISIQSEVTHDLDKVKLVTARGFKPIDVILEMTRVYAEKKGKYFLLKGRKEKIDEELTLTQKKFKNLAVKIENTKSPVLDVERNLVLINF